MYIFTQCVSVLFRSQSNRTVLVPLLSNFTNFEFRGKRIAAFPFASNFAGRVHWDHQNCSKYQFSSVHSSSARCLNQHRKCKKIGLNCPSLDEKFRKIFRICLSSPLWGEDKAILDRMLRNSTERSAFAQSVLCVGWW